MRYAIIIGLVLACILAILILLYFAPTPDALYSRQQTAEIRALTALERAKADYLQTQIKARVALAKLEHDERINAAPTVIRARIVTRALLAAWLPLALMTAATVGAGYLCFVAIRRVPFRAGEIETFVTRRDAARLAEQEIFVHGLDAQARALAFRETLSQQRFRAGVGLFAALGRAWRSGNAEQLALAAETERPAAEIPSFAEILASRELHGEMILGYTPDGEPIPGRFDAVHSCLIYGLAGSGKTSWLRALTAQTIATEPESRFFVLDPHEARQDGLLRSLPKTPHFVPIDAGRPQAAFQMIGKELTRRLTSTDDHFPPAVLLIDELPTLTKRDYAKPLKALCEAIAQQGRKVNVFLLASAQDLRERKIGDFRSSLSSAYFCKGKAAQVKAFLGNDRDAEQQFKTIHAPGAALFSATNDEPRLVRLPKCGPADLKCLESGQMPTTAAPTTAAKQPETPTETSGNADAGNADAGNADAPTFGELVRERLAEVGISQNKLAELAGISKKDMSLYMNGKPVSESTKAQIYAILAEAEKRGNTLETQAVTEIKAQIS